MDRLDIDACIGSELKDSQGETLSVEGADISDLQSGNGRWNDNHGKGFFNSLGRVTFAKKIFGPEDIEDERQQYYWDKVKSPYIYAKGYLFNDDDDHYNAKAAAAILKNLNKTDAPLKIKASVEGGVVSRGVKDPSYLARTKIHSVALTFTPANNATLVEPLSLKKSDTSFEESELIKSVIPLAKNNVPSFIDISNELRLLKIKDNVYKINSLVKVDLKNLYGYKKPIEMETPKKVSPSTVTTIATKTPLQVPADNIKESTLQPEQRKMIQDKAVMSPAAPVVNVQNKMSQAGNTTAPIVTPEQRNMNLIEGHHAAKAIKDLGHLDRMPDVLRQEGHSDESINKLMSAVKDRVYATNTDFKGHAMRAARDKDYLRAKATSMLRENHPKESIVKFLQNIKDQMGKLDKAMFAGYGGSGSPMQSTGGSVIQSEALDMGRGFKYVTCPDCGKDQVYSKDQIRCRGCGKNFSLKKIFDITRK